LELDEEEDNFEIDFEDAQDAFDTPAAGHGQGTPATAFASARQQQATAYKTGSERVPGAQAGWHAVCHPAFLSVASSRMAEEHPIPMACKLQWSLQAC
jgi:hypothetical protein